MNPQTAALVRDSWAEIVPMRKQVCTGFYDRLFQRHPELRPLFKGDIDRQTGLFVTMLNTVVSSLENRDPVIPLIKAVGARHAGYGVENADYEKFAGVLLDSFAAALGERFTPDVRAAWLEVYRQLADTMRQGAAEALH
ncbi:MAG: globin domain-containing protein [Thiohalocapsa sp.]|uniref:globin domain-containing protein n=1 Tax=Thiohalocapsa sp. TaxID=2497641 RepID=UPI0025D82CFA|nr:globin domain-containing protein [Thiohalocapsa sp.]MCG6942205.1 globin domain-containing protein [Thiohalocapsa sp.]